MSAADDDDDDDEGFGDVYFTGDDFEGFDDRFVGDNFDIGDEKKYYPEIDDDKTDFNKSIHSIGPTDQGDLDSCAIWSLTNAITRAFSIHYNLINHDKRNIVWKEYSKTNCTNYIKNSFGYKYCILFNFFQLFIRKKAGTCGITRDNILGAIQTINEDLFVNKDDMNSNIISLGSESDIHVNEFKKKRFEIRRDYRKISKTAEFQKIFKNEKNKSLRKKNPSTQENTSTRKRDLLFRTEDLYNRYKKMIQRGNEVKETINNSHIQDLSDIFLELIGLNVVLKTANLHDFQLIIQLVNKHGYYGVIGITFQHSWYVLFRKITENPDVNNDIFAQLRTLTIGADTYGHAVVLKRIRYNMGTEEYEFLIKNSWGAGWGDNGEIWIPRGCLPLLYSIDVIYLDIDHHPVDAAAPAAATEEYFGGKIKSRKFKKSNKSKKSNKTKKRRK